MKVWTLNVYQVYTIPLFSESFLCREYSDIYRRKGNYKSFAEMLQFLFGPMFEATINPKSHPEMAKFMTQVIEIR